MPGGGSQAFSNSESHFFKAQFPKADLKGEWQWQTAGVGEVGLISSIFLVLNGA